MKHDFADGKYTVINDNGTLTALRNGEPWGRDLVGDNLVYWMLVEVDRLKQLLSAEQAQQPTVPEPVNQMLQGCACRWDADDNRVATCVRHQGWLDVVQEWADRAKAAEQAPQPTDPEDEDDDDDLTIAYMAGYHKGKRDAQPTEPTDAELDAVWENMAPSW